LFELHQEREAWGTIAVHQREVKIDYGVVEVTTDGLLGDYIEKPTIPYEVSMGINVLSRRCLEFIPESGRLDMPELMLAMRNAGKPVACYRTDCYWQDIGRFDDYEQANQDFVANPAKFLAPLRTTPMKRVA
jgi:NDP-sugar pyrophosphorylase family protein